MEKLSAVRADLANRSLSMGIMVDWLDRGVCRARPAQGVAGQREYPPGRIVDAGMVSRNEVEAHLCPFVKPSIDADLFWIRESDLGIGDAPAIEKMLLAEIDEFKNAAPAFDPYINRTPAPESGSPAPIIKTFLTFFPNISPTPLPAGGARCQVVLDIHRNLKLTRFMPHGLMFGEFYRGYREHGGIYNPAFWSLTAPRTALAIRYMVKRDIIFVHKEPAELAAYRIYFP
jgi:Domain of unknown function (DUF6875)